MAIIVRHETVEIESERQPRGRRHSGRAAARRRTLAFRTLRELKQRGTLVAVANQRP